MRLTRCVLLLVAALLSARVSAAQETCNISRELAPDFRGVRLGMKAEELQEMFPASQQLRPAAPLKAADAGRVANISLGRLELYIRKNDFKDVEELSLGLLRGRLHRISVHFVKPAVWRDVDEFADNLSKQLALPLAWRAPVRSGTKQSRLMDCRGFTVLAQVTEDGGSLLSILDTTEEKEEKKEAKTEDKKKPPARKPVRRQR